VNNISENKATVPEFLIFPVPATDQIIISSKKIEPEVLARIIDLTGNVLQSIKISGKFPGEIRLDISTLKKGFYLINLISEVKSETHKILINR